LAWQEKPGMPMGQAITARVLRYDKGKSDRFCGMVKMSIQFMMKSA
jgi:hypothetical protein